MKYLRLSGKTRNTIYCVQRVDKINILWYNLSLKGGVAFDCRIPKQKAALIAGTINTARSEYLYTNRYKFIIADIRSIVNITKGFLLFINKKSFGVLTFLLSDVAGT